MFISTKSLRAADNPSMLPHTNQTGWLCWRSPKYLAKLTFPRMVFKTPVWGNPCTARTSRALHATFRLDSPVKKPHTDPFQTPSKLGNPSYPNAPKFKSLKLPQLKTNASYIPFL